MTPEEIEKEAVNHCDEVMCSICEKGSCPPLKKCREWRDRRAGYYCGIESREKRFEELERQIEQLQTINNEQKETLKKVRVALIQERAANIMNYGKGGVEMFDSLFEILKGVSN